MCSRFFACSPSPVSLWPPPGVRRVGTCCPEARHAPTPRAPPEFSPECCRCPKPRRAERLCPEHLRLSSAPSAAASSCYHPKLRMSPTQAPPVVAPTPASMAMAPSTVSASAATPPWPSRRSPPCRCSAPRLPSARRPPRASTNCCCSGVQTRREGCTEVNATKVFERMPLPVSLTNVSRLECHWHVSPTNGAKQSTLLECSHSSNQTENWSGSILASKCGAEPFNSQNLEQNHSILSDSGTKRHLSVALMETFVDVFQCL
jgi:hypothetical protein